MSRGGIVSASGFQLVASTEYWNVWSRPTFYSQRRNYFTQDALAYLDLVIRQLAADFGYSIFPIPPGASYDPARMDVVLDPASQGGAHTGDVFGSHGISISPDAIYNSFNDIPQFWWYILALHETVNVYTGALARGWIWADGSPLWAGTSPFPNMCLPPEEEVITSRGLRPIADVKEGDSVLTHKGRFQKVSRTFVRPYRGKLLSINGVKMTPEHPVLTRVMREVDGNGMYSTELWAWTEAKGLMVAGSQKERYLLFLPRISEVVDREQSEDLPVNQHSMTVAGYFLSAGRTALDEKHAETTFVFGPSVEETHHVNELVSALKDLGLNPRAHFKKNCTRLEVTSRKLARFLEAQFGAAAKDRHVPSWVKRLPPEKLQPLFDSYVNGDVHRQTDDAIIVSRCDSRESMYDLRDVALKLGYVSSALERPWPTLETTSTPQRHGAVSIGGRYEVGSDRDGIYPRIESICDMEHDGLVYNLSVQVDNSFCTRSFAVHNCDILVTGELGYGRVSSAQSARLAQDAGVRLLLDLQKRHGWRIYRELFRHTRAKGIEDWRAFPEPMRSSMIIWFLSSAAGEDLLPRFNDVIGSVSGKQIPVTAYQDAQRLMDLQGEVDR